MRRFLVSGAAALASFVGVALAAGFASGPVSAQCMVVTCPQPATPVPAPPLQAPPLQAPPAVDAYDEGFAAGRAAGRAEAAAERRPAARPAQRQTTRQRTAGSRRQEARRQPQRQASRPQAARPQAARPQAARPQARRHPAPPAPPRQAWQSRTRDLATTYGATNGQAVALSQFTGRGDRWVSSSYSRTVWVGPSITSWSGGQLCGWGSQAVMQGSVTVSQSPAWLCQCEQGWRPPAGH